MSETDRIGDWITTRGNSRVHNERNKHNDYKEQRPWHSLFREMFWWLFAIRWILILGAMGVGLAVLLLPSAFATGPRLAGLFPICKD